jgi:flagellar P-ring protein precursor FlgI
MRAYIAIPLALAALSSTFACAPAHAERIKDLAQVAGVRGNPLVGYGLVVGLDGSGDRTSQTPFTVQSLKTMLDQLGVTIPPGVNPQLKNVAAVAIQAELPAFAKPGQTIDVTVSSIGNAGSLRGGALLMAPLRARMARCTRSRRATWWSAASAHRAGTARASRSTHPTAAAFPMARSSSARSPPPHPTAA